MSVEFLTSKSLAPLTHGFFTRRGGVSDGIVGGLNCGWAPTDHADAVKENRRLVLEALNLGGLALVNPKQVHSADVLSVTAPFTGPPPKADAVVTAQTNLPLAILTADCQPVLFADPVHNVIGAAHAGWKGALGGILGETIQAMVKLGAQRQHIRAVIGPTISQKSYEVGPEFFAAFTKQDPSSGDLFAAGKNDRMQFDLPAFGLRQLERASIGAAEWIGECTYETPEKFYSYRRATHQGDADYGRLISVISLG